MNILFLTHYDNMYGANKAMYKLICKLKEEMPEANITLAIPAEGEMTKALTKIGVDFYISGGTKWQAFYSTPLRFMVKKIMRRRLIKMESDNLYEEFKDKNIDVIHSNSSVTNLGALLAERLSCRHIWHIREFSYEHFNMRYFYSQKRVIELYEKADYLITISDSLKENIKEKYKGANVVRVYDGVNGDYKASEGMGEGLTRFVYSGYLFPMKNQLEVLKAAKKLKDRGIDNFEVDIAGDGESAYRKKLEEYIDNNNLDNVKLLGYVNNIHALLDTADAGIIASRYEGFGLVTVEYMLHSLPVIGYNGGGNAEIIKDGETGYLYDDLDELVRQMEEIIKNKEKARGMGEKGRLRAINNFSEEKNADELIKIYKSIEDMYE